jgi:methylglutamate dehydrogenase subunit D
MLINPISPAPLQIGDVTVTVRDTPALATLHCRNAKGTALRQRILQRFSVELPGGPKWIHSSDIRFGGLGPGAWLAASEKEGSAFVEHLTGELGDVAAICNQSDAYAVLRITGPTVRDLLCRLFTVDLDADVFLCDELAVTMAAHIKVILWRLEDIGARSAFEIAVPRSYAAGFWSMLSSASPF